MTDRTQDLKEQYSAYITEDLVRFHRTACVCPVLRRLAWGYIVTTGVPSLDFLLVEETYPDMNLALPSEEDFMDMNDPKGWRKQTNEKVALMRDYFKSIIDVSKALDREGLAPIIAYAEVQYTRVRDLYLLLTLKTREE